MLQLYGHSVLRRDVMSLSVKLEKSIVNVEVQCHNQCRVLIQKVN